MPQVSLYLDEEGYKLYKRARELLENLSKKYGTRLKISQYFKSFLKQLVENLEKGNIKEVTIAEIVIPVIKIVTKQE